MTNPGTFLRRLFETAISAAAPHHVVGPYLPSPPAGRTVVVGAGKAAAAMASAVETAAPGPMEGIVVTRYGHDAPCHSIDVVEAGHPIPDAIGQTTAQRLLRLAKSLTPNDLLLCLWSGGGSALLTLPGFGVSLEDKQLINLQLLKSGAAITEINCVRKHLSAIKGGRLAEAAQGARIESLIISDVAGDDLAVIASGPTVGDPTSCTDALDILQHYDINAPSTLTDMLRTGVSETPWPDDPLFEKTRHHIIASGQQSLTAAMSLAESRGFRVISLGDQIEGDSRQVALNHAAQFRQYIAGDPTLPLVMFSGGETTVTVRGQGRGGPNREFLLALALELDADPTIWALAGYTDGIDGSDDDAGAVISPDTLQRAALLGVDAADALEKNNVGQFFYAIGDNLTTGPTRTNVNDFRVLLYQPDT